MLGVLFGELCVKQLLVKDFAGRHIFRRGDHGCQDGAGEGVSAAVVPQVQDQFLHALLLEGPEHALQVPGGLHGETGEVQIADGFPVHRQGAGGLNRILVHLHGFQGDGFSGREAQPDRLALVKLLEQRGVVVGRQFFPVQGGDDVSAQDAGFRGGGRPVGILHDHADFFLGLVGIVQAELEAVAQVVAGEASQEAVVIRQHAGPFVHQVPVRVLVAGSLHFLYRVVPVLPVGQGVGHLVHPEVESVHNIECEQVGVVGKTFFSGGVHRVFGPLAGAGQQQGRQ